jgi:hypothetical protein
MLAAIGRLAPALITAQQACCLRLDRERFGWRARAMQEA